MAFAGLVIAFGPSFYLYKLIISLTEKVTDAEVEDEILNSKMDRGINTAEIYKTFVKRDIDHITSLRDAADFPANLEKAGMTLGSYREESAKIEDKHLGTSDKLETMLMELKEAKAKHHGNVKRLRFLLTQVNILKFLVTVTLTIGLSMASYGFYKWFIIQEFIDKTIIKEALKN